jgi:protein-tyrosine phosphatase
MSIIKILMICHGNICRSPMAEFIMKDLVKKAGLSDTIYVESAAATTEELGHDMYPPAKRKLTQMGVPFAPRKARLVKEKDYDAFDFLIGMDEENYDDLMDVTHGDPEGKVHYLLSFADEKRDVADPWYTGNFDAAYTDILSGCEGLLQYLRETYKLK